MCAELRDVDAQEAVRCVHLRACELRCVHLRAGSSSRCVLVFHHGAYICVLVSLGAYICVLVSLGAYICIQGAYICVHLRACELVTCVQSLNSNWYIWDHTYLLYFKID